MATGSTALAEQFYGEFQAQSQQIHDVLDEYTAEKNKAFKDPKESRSDTRRAATEAATVVVIDRCLTDVAALQRRVRDATVYTNNHDQRVYAAGIKALQDKIETLRSSAQGTKTKFSFKSARRAAPSPLPTGTGTARATAASTRSTVLAAVGSSSIVEDSKLAPQDDLQSTVGNLLGTSASNVATLRAFRLSKEALSQANNPSVQHAQQCVIDLWTDQEMPFPGLHVTSLENCLIACGSISGGLHITAVRSSILIAETHQFRMHRCSDVVIYLTAGSSPIIEDCENIRFAPLRSSVNSLLKIPRNAWNQVLDFQFPGLQGPSPNWSEVPESSRLDISANKDQGLRISGVSSSGEDVATALRQSFLSAGLQMTHENSRHAPPK